MNSEKEKIYQLGEFNYKYIQDIGEGSGGKVEKVERQEDKKM